MTAAIAAARQGASVTILEKKEMPGKKILSTGNGRCNLTNMDMKAAYFRGGDPGTVKKVLASFGAEDTLRFFAGLGLLTKTRGTLVYPSNDQAASVREALAMELRRLHVDVRTGFAVCAAEQKEGRFHVTAKGPEGDVRLTGDALILAAGGMAAPALGSDGSGYRLAGSFGHRIIRPLPALVQLRSVESFLKKTAGVRTDGTVRLYADGRLAAQDTGEIQFTDYGLSGIPVFQVSRFASAALAEGRKVQAVLDLLPGLQPEELSALFEARRQTFAGNTAEEFLHGIFHRKLAPVLLTQSRIRWKDKVADIAPGAMQKLARVCKALELEITGVNRFDQAQVCAGGVDLTEVVPDTMESALVRGLYLTGELLDADGLCGGYNLQWAWATGYLAGRAAGQRRRRDV